MGYKIGDIFELDDGYFIEIESIDLDNDIYRMDNGQLYNEEMLGGRIISREKKLKEVKEVLDTVEDKNMSSFGMTWEEVQEGAYKVYKKEEVVHPEHYNQGIEAIDYIESHNFNFNLGNAIKYITRCEHKEDKLNNLEKAKWYIEREIERESVNNE